MSFRKAEQYLERTIQLTQQMCQRRLERELSIDGLCMRLSQIADALYLGMILATLPVGMYSISRAIAPAYEKEQQRIERYEAQLVESERR